jgi:hypothetical protein
MVVLGWFVEEAMKLSGKPYDEWDKLSRQEQIEIIHRWQEKEPPAKDDYVVKANFMGNCAKCGATVAHGHAHQYANKKWMLLFKCPTCNIESNGIFIKQRKV